MARHESDALAPCLLHLRREAPDRVIPGDGLPLAVPRPLQRTGDAVGVVEPLQTRLAARAQPSVVDRRLGVPLELHDAALAHLGVQPAPRRALPARPAA